MSRKGDRKRSFWRKKEDQRRCFCGGLDRERKKEEREKI